MANYQTSASCFTSTSATPNSSDYNCDVFLNHRGPDVKKTFASHLYRRLLSYGFRVFLDRLEMQAGDGLTCQLKGAIAAASVHIAIFSPRYAESKWCLEELVLMLESGTAIIPVFYHVKPSDLRISTGSGEDGVYGRAIRDLEKKRRYQPNTVKKWREALSRVAEISGLELEACNGDEGELVDKVLQLVQKRARKPPLDVATYPIGLDEKLQEFERTAVLQHFGGHWVAGIVGVGGVGKTTLAKQFFNRKRSDYDRSSFLFDVREAAARGSLTSLQSKLYEDLTGQDQVMNSIDEGISRLRHHVRRCQALVIVDDVDSVEQLRVLFSPVKDVLSSGLNREHSQELFCLHAFHQPYPVVGFDKPVREFLEVCQGLPLSLKVIGALLYSESPDFRHWKTQLLKISKVLPTDIQSRLKISFDSLDEQEREMFLDIACFFIGEDKDKAIRVWDGSGWEGSIGFQNLLNKYLVEVDSKNCIRMHDHLRDLGRALAKKDPRLRLWHLTDEILSNVIHQPYVRGIRIQTSALSSDNVVEIGNRFVDARGLQLLKVEGDWCESISNLLRQSNLLWLRWDISSLNRISENVSEIVSSPEGCSEIVSSPDGGSEIVSEIDSPLRHWCSEIDSPLRHWHSEIVSSSHEFSEIPSEIVSSSHAISEIASSSSYGRLEFDSSRRPSRYSLPSWIPMKNLRVLEVVGSEIQLETLWKNESEAPLRLRELNIIGPDLLQLPRSIGQLKHLEKIQFTYPVKTLPEEFFHLRSLKHLIMRTTMKLLPNAFGNLANLQHLNFAGSYDLQMLPDSFGNLTNLQYLNLHGCSQLEVLPHSFGNLVQLKHLCLKGCSQLTFSKETLRNIRALQSLDLSGCRKMEILPPQVTHQRFLEKLLLWNTSLRELPSAIGNLGKLEILRVSSEDSCMEMLPPSLGNLKSLKELILFGGKCKCLFDSIGKLKQLTNITIDCGTIEYLPAGVRELNNLEILKAMNCPVRQVPFGRVGNVGEKIDTSADQGGRSLVYSSIDHKWMLPRLKQLDLHGTRISELAFDEGVCPNLRQLDISDCLELVEVGALPKKLIFLDLNGCDALKKVTGLSGLAKLRELDMRKCEAVEELPGLETLISLVHLRVSGCSKLKSIRGLAQATNLHTLESQDHDSDLIESKLFKELKLWKSWLQEPQLEGENFWWGE